MYAHDHQLEALEEAAMAFIEEHALLFHREAMPTLSLLGPRSHHLWLAVTGLLTAGFSSALHAAEAGGGGGRAAGAAAST